MSVLRGLAEHIVNHLWTLPLPYVAVNADPNVRLWPPYDSERTLPRSEECRAQGSPMFCVIGTWANPPKSLYCLALRVKWIRDNEIGWGGAQ